MGRGFALRVSGAMFLAGPAAIHFAVAPEHLRSYLPYGIFFIVLGAAQVALVALILLRPSSPALLGGALLSLLIIALWLVSRTIGLPVAPVPWQPEAVGLPDFLSTFMEWIAVWLLLAADARLGAGRVWRAWRAAPGMSLATVGSAAMTVAGLAAVGGGH